MKKYYKEKRGTEIFLQTIQEKKTKWILHILRRNCLLKNVTEGKIEGSVEATKRERKRSEQLLDDFKEMTGYWKFINEALDRTLWRTRIGIAYGPTQDRVRNE
jgi:hypothetical protein